MSELEKESLEAHVDLCAERYINLKNEFTNMGSRMDKFEAMLQEIRDTIHQFKADRNQQLINWGVGLIATLATGCGTLLFLLLTK
jgi:DNA anti-recombination protein RmuC